MEDMNMSTETMGELSRGIEPTTRAFLEKINAMRGPKIYEMSVEDARKTLSGLQASTAVPMMPADIEEMDIPGGPTDKVRVHIIRPKGGTEILPVTMYYHGAGWVLGGFDTHERLVRELSNKANTAVVFVDYSRSPEVKYPVPLEEDYRAMEYVADNGKQLNLDGSRLAVAGDSVGGNMATVMTMMAKERKGPKIRYQVLFYPVTDAAFDKASYQQYAKGYWLARKGMEWFWDNYLPGKLGRKQPMATPLNATLDDLKGLPPALVITSEYDVLRDEGEAYAHKLMDAGVRTTAVRFLGAIHDMVMLNALADTPTARGAIDLASAMLCEAFAR
jgi:acetyl esterase